MSKQIGLNDMSNKEQTEVQEKAITLSDLDAYIESCDNDHEEAFRHGTRQGGVVFDSQPECGDPHEYTWVDCWPGGKDHDGGLIEDEDQRRVVQRPFAVQLLTEWAIRYDIHELHDLAAEVKSGLREPTDILAQTAKAFAKAGWGAYEWIEEPAIEMWRLAPGVQATIKRVNGYDKVAKKAYAAKHLTALHQDLKELGAELDGLVAGGGIHLEGQPDANDPAELSHIDCWPGGESYEPKEGEPDLDDASDEEIKAAYNACGARLMATFAKEYNIPELARIAKKYDRDTNEIDTFAVLCHGMANRGYAVYNGDLGFEAYTLEPPAKRAVRAIHAAACKILKVPKAQAKRAVVVHDGEHLIARIGSPWTWCQQWMLYDSEGKWDFRPLADE